MRRIPTLSAALLAVAMILAGTGCNYLKSRDHINQGIASYKNAKYSDAVDRAQSRSVSALKVSCVDATSLYELP